MRIVVVDNHPLFREGLAMLFSRQPDFTIVGDGATVEDAVRLVGTLAPDIVTLDLSIPGGGLNALHQIGAASPSTKPIILTAVEDESAMLAAMNAGARGFALKTIAPAQFINVIYEVQAGMTYVPAELAMRVVINVANSAIKNNFSRLNTLTEHEQQILRLVSSGSSNRQIATALNRTEACIKNQMTVIMKKLQVNNRVQAAMVLNRSA
jgi:DNA-binding NarL/FixJ family response regulator